MKAACYCGTRNLYKDMIPAVNSLLKNSDVDKVYLLIEDDVFPYKMPDCVETINVKDQPYFTHNGPNFKNGWTYMVLMRAALHRIFPELDEILSLDIDTIVAKDISGLWDYDITDYYVAGVKEPGKSRSHIYINCGVMRLNLKKLRDGMGDDIINALNTRHYDFNEQDCINEMCHDWILELPSDYNSNHFTTPTTTPKIVHFAAIRNYQNNALVKMYANMGISG